MAITIATHDGDFHLDDIFAVATLKILLDEEVQIVRTRDPEIISAAAYAVDIGAEYSPATQRFDHHQVGGAGKRENEIPYAAFGLVWKEFGREVCGSEDVARIVDTKFVQGIDAIDNGVPIVEPLYEDVMPVSLHDVAFVFRPTWKEKESMADENFVRFVELAVVYLKRIIKVVKDAGEAEDLVRRAYEEAPDKRVIVLDDRYPFRDVLTEYPEPLFAVYPKQGIWRVRAISEPITFKNRVDLFSGWAGKRDEELQQASGVPDALFVHNALFLGGAKTREGAIKLAELSIKYATEQIEN